MNIEWIISPLIGGIIGLVTNTIAIKMLFHPYYEVRIGKFRLPFTPGMIPKERPRIAKAIGRVVGDELLDPKTMEQALCSKQVQEVLGARVDEVMQEYTTNECSLSEYVEKKKLKEKVDEIEREFSEKAGDYVAKELIERKVSEQLLDVAMDEIMQHLNPLLLTMASGAIGAAKEPLAERMNEMIAEHCPGIVNRYIDEKYEEMLETKVQNVAHGVEQKIPDISGLLWNVYTTIVKEKSQSFLQAVNISQIVEDKINAYDIKAFEALLLDICRKELRAVIWIGGLLGILLGFVNLIF